jgi:hypothetical protein
LSQRVSAARSELKATQQRVLTALEGNGTTRLTRGLYEEIAGVSRSQAAYDLAELVSAGILERVGGGRSTWYRLARTERPGQRHWTDERIRSALEEFCDGRDAWPSASEFKAAGHSDLYVAASRYGGISFWTSELGFSRPARTAAPAPAPAPRRRWRPKLGWAAGGVAFAAALFAAGGASFYAWHGTPAHRAASPRASHALRLPVDAFRGPRVQATHRAAVKKQSVHHAAVKRPSQSGAAELAVQTNTVPARQVVSSRSTAATQPSGQSSAPAPLPAPIGTGGGPAPIPPPNR